MERFWSKVNKRGDEECWEWTGAKHENGYGEFWNKGGSSRAHRKAWELTHGPIPEGLHILHRCDNRPCCNPGHLFLGTAGINHADKIRKGRNRPAFGVRNGAYTHPEKRPRGDSHGSRLHPERLVRGEQVCTAKLTEAQVREIRERAARGEPRRRLVAEYGVSQTMIGDIIVRKAWKHLK